MRLLLVLFFLWQSSSNQPPDGYLRLSSAGNYESTKTYAVGDLVLDGSHYYAAFKPTKGEEPSQNPSTWMALPADDTKPIYIVWGPLDISGNSLDVKLTLAVFKQSNTYICQHTRAITNFVPPPAIAKLLSDTPRMVFKYNDGANFTVAGPVGHYAYVCVGN